MRVHILRFASEAEAIADPLVGAYHYPRDEDGNPPRWDSSMMEAGFLTYVDGVLQPGFSPMIATNDANVALAQHPKCLLAWDFSTGAIYGGTMTGNDLAHFYGAPMFAGGIIPWSGPAPL